MIALTWEEQRTPGRRRSVKKSASLGDVFDVVRKRLQVMAKGWRRCGGEPECSEF
jgi:hypothetical protein